MHSYDNNRASALAQGKESKTLQLQVSQLRTQLESERMEVKRLTSIVATLREEAESTKRYSDNLSREVRSTRVYSYSASSGTYIYKLIERALNARDAIHSSSPSASIAHSSSRCAASASATTCASSR